MMSLYLIGLTIDGIAVLALAGYLFYQSIWKKEKDEFFFVRPIIALMVTESLLSLYFLHLGDLNLASVIVWVQAVAVMVTLLFILLIIIFKPDWH